MKEHRRSWEHSTFCFVHLDLRTFHFLQSYHVLSIPDVGMALVVYLLTRLIIKDKDKRKDKRMDKLKYQYKRKHEHEHKHKQKDKQKQKDKH